MQTHQKYYKLISLSSAWFKTDETDPDNAPLIYDKELKPYLFNSTLFESLETIQLESIYKDKRSNFAFGFDKHGKKKKLSSHSSLYLGHQTTLINVEILPEHRLQLYKNGFRFNNTLYVRYKRSASSAKDGHCLFIDKRISKQMMEWSSCGLKKINPKLETDFQAYIALVLSGIKGTFQLPPESILIMDDQHSRFSSHVMNITIKKEKGKGKKAEKSVATANPEKVEIDNNIWDGQALLDDSVFQDISGFEDKSMLLLRNRFFKTCAFRTRLQKWFADSKTQLSDINGFTLAKDIKDIKLVITPSSLKYYKFFKPADFAEGTYLQEVFLRWLSVVNDSPSSGSPLTFGIVKSDLPSKHIDGKMCQTNYQFLSTLNLSPEDVNELLKPTASYVDNLRKDPAYFLHYASTCTNGMINNHPLDIVYLYETCLHTLPLTNKFSGTDIYHDFVDREIQKIRNTISSGKILINGTYATLFGNCIEFLYATTHLEYNPKYNAPMTSELGNIPTLTGNQIYTPFFNFNTEICGCRSPHITMGNLFIGQNTDNDFISQYFVLSPYIVCVNAIEHNIMHRLNGADYDSDTMLITDNSIIVKAAKKYYDKFLVPYSKPNVLAKTKSCRNKSERLRRIDEQICYNMIGLISNLAFVVNNMLWDNYNRIEARGGDDYETDGYYQTLSILAVLSNLEIDKAKRDHGYNVSQLYKVIEQDISSFMYEHVADVGRIKRTLLPDFFKKQLGSSSSKILKRISFHKSYFVDSKILEVESEDWRCTLNYLNNYNLSLSNNERTKYSLTQLIRNVGFKEDCNDSTHKQNLLSCCISASTKIKQIQAAKKEYTKDYAIANANSKHMQLLHDYFQEITKKAHSEIVVYRILKADKPPCNALLFSGLLFSKHKHLLRMLYEANKNEETFELVPAEEGDTGTVSLFGHPYKKQKIVKEDLPFIKAMLK